MKYTKSMKLRRRNVASTLRVLPRERPVTRRRMFPFGSTIEYWLPGTHWAKPGAGSISTVYRALSPGSVRHARGSIPVPFHLGFTGAGCPGAGSGRPELHSV